MTEAIHTHPAVERIRALLIAEGVGDTIIVMPSATHTAQAAAETLGCTLGEIAKSIIFRAADDGGVLVITSGRNRVDDKKVATHLGLKLGKADANFVRAKTGYVIGGVAPLIHAQPLRVLMDRDLLQYPTVYPAAGHPHTMFRISPQRLAALAHAEVTDVALVPT